jgi:hypothetical protein
LFLQRCLSSLLVLLRLALRSSHPQVDYVEERERFVSETELCCRGVYIPFAYAYLALHHLIHFLLHHHHLPLPPLLLDPVV